MRRLITAFVAAAAFSLAGCGTEDADPAGSEQDSHPSSEPAPSAQSVSLTQSGGFAGISRTWKVGPSDKGHEAVFDAAAPGALEGAEGSKGPPPCCDLFQYDLIVRYSDGSTESFRLYDGGSADPALNRLVDAVLNTKPLHPDSTPLS